jgi:hypothetical protein
MKYIFAWFLQLDHLLKIKVMSPVFVNKLRSIFLSNILEIAERPVGMLQFGIILT